MQVAAVDLSLICLQVDLELEKNLRPGLVVEFLTVMHKVAWVEAYNP